MDEQHNLTNSSSSLDTKSESINLEGYSVEVKCAFEIVSFGCIIYSVLALVALRRTKSTPETARFFTSALISYDIIAVFSFNVRKFVENHDWNTIIQVFGVSFCNLALVTIGLMSLERLVIFYSPYFYLRYVTTELVKKSTITCWIVYFISYWFVRIAVCAITHPPFVFINVIGACNKITFYYYGLAISFVSIMSLLCYAKILLIIRKERMQTSTTGNISTNTINLKFLRNYRSTSLVFVYSVTSIASAVMYAIIISLNLGPIPLRLWNDAINTLCCTMDPFVYVIWYKECRMEMLKLFSCWFPSLQPRVEQMRRDIFYIP